MLSLSGPKARVLLQLLIPLVTWSVVNVTTEVKDFRLISLYTNRVSREEVGCRGLTLKTNIFMISTLLRNTSRTRSCEIINKKTR